jgi:GT2 family glycosyltransferase/glycosyltransferase involved in cell wall biosynthesis
MNRDPNLTVIIPVYNHERYVAEALDSVLGQTFGDFELIVVDDGSQDRSADIVAGYADPRIRFVRQANRGSHGAINRGLDLARGEYIAVLNSDDRYHPERLERIFAFARERTLDFVVTDFRLIDKEGVEIANPEHWWLKMVAPFRLACREQGPVEGLLHGNYTVSTSNFFFKAQLVKAIGRFRHFRYILDWDYALRAAFFRPEGYGFLDEPLFDYRLHGENAILQDGLRCSIEISHLYSNLLMREEPRYRPALQRLRYFRRDIRRTVARRLGQRNELLSAHLDQAGEIIAERERHIAALEAQSREIIAERERHIDLLKEQCQQLDGQIQQLDRQIKDLEQTSAELRAELDRIYASRSWRLTEPLRRGAAAIREARGRIVPRLRPLWLRLPIPSGRRFAVKSILFRTVPALFRGTAAYSAWQQQFDWSAQAVRLPIGAPLEPVPEGLTIPIDSRPPKVSVIVPVYNKLLYTLACLDSIARHLPDVPIEVLVVDDASSDDTAAVLGARTDIRYLRNPENLGFIGSCNRGAAEARGEFLCFLNNDTQVMSGWLDAMTRTLETEPGAGLVGAKLIYPNGTLQEAGGIVWADGSGWNWGRGGDPQAPEFNFLRDADYCSGACILIRAGLFNELGGFDPCYVPAYYEDTDLAFKVRDRSLRVLYQPLARVIHYEGISCGTDVGSGIKAYQEKNRATFAARWREALAAHGSPETGAPRLAADRRPIRRCLIIDACTPTPDQDSGSQDMYHLMRLFLALGYRISFIPESNLLYFGRYTESLQGMGVECLYQPFISSVESFLSQRGGEFDLVMLVRGPNAVRHIDAVRRYCPQAKIVFNTVDLHFLREERRALLESGRAKSGAAAEMRRMEFEVMNKSHLTLVVSEVERELLGREAPGVDVAVLPLIRDFAPCATGYAERSGIVFVGGFRHPPNVDAVHYFCREIWPQVRAELPDAAFSIIGSHMPSEVEALAGDGVKVLGFVPDLAPVMERCRLSVAPLRYGAGLKGKVAESLGFGTPCVATSAAVEGMGLADGEQVLVADTPQAFAEAVIRLYRDPAMWERLSQAGFEAVRARFGLEAARRRLEEILHELNLA